MLILLTGASGFIGRPLSHALEAAGHKVRRAQRSYTGVHDTVQADFTRDLAVSDWLPRLVGVDAVINAVGILRQQGGQTFERLHTLAPRALFDACLARGVRRIVQISALGADDGTTAYFASKHAADAYLAASALDWTIVRPSLVYGASGASARLFTMWASLPLIPLPGDGRQQVQPIHIDDLVAAIVACLECRSVVRQRVPLVGPQPLALRDFLGCLRRSMESDATIRYMPLPVPLVRIAARIASLDKRSLLDRDALTMLEAGNTASPSMTARLLGQAPRDVASFISQEDRAAVLTQARWSWLEPLLRVSIAAVWIWTGIVSLGWYPLAASYALLARVGITGPAATLSLYGASALDLAFGAATLLVARRRYLWLAQLATIAAYTLIISVALPEYWLHPYGPILKNLPLLAAIYLLYTLEPRS